MHRVALIVRSYNRPAYLRETLDSLLRADIDLCCERLIYDDGSTDPEVKSLLCDSITNVPGKAFSIVQGSVNVGCKHSYIIALNALTSSYDFICTVDNDVHVKPNFVSTLLRTYQDAHRVYGTKNILLTGFDPSNAHLNSLETHETFYRKKSCGGVSFFFEKSFKPFIIDAWNLNLDWGVVHMMSRYKFPIVCTKPGVVQHIGAHGLNSSGTRFDQDESFDRDSTISTLSS